MEKRIIVVVAISFLLIFVSMTFIEKKEVNNFIELSSTEAKVLSAENLNLNTQNLKNKVSYISTNTTFDAPLKRRTKPFTSYWIFRILLLLSAFFLYLPYILLLFFREIKINKSCYNLSIVFILVTTIPIVMNLAVFNLPYSLLGKYERLSPPEDQILFEDRQDRCGLSEQVRGISLYCIWRLYRSGLSISSFPYGEIFIPFQDITQLKTPKESFSSSYTLYLHNRELRLFKIALPNEDIFRKLTWLTCLANQQDSKKQLNSYSTQKNDRI